MTQSHKNKNRIIKIVLFLILTAVTIWLIYLNVKATLSVNDKINELKTIKEPTKDVKDMISYWKSECLNRIVGVGVVVVFYFIIWICVHYVGPVKGERIRISKSEAKKYIKEIEREYEENDLVIHENEYSKDDGENIQMPTSIDSPEIIRMYYKHQAVNIRWNPVEYAEGYVIYRHIGKEKWQRIGRTTSNITNYEDYNIDSNVTYIYAIRAYFNTEEGKVVSTLDPLGKEIYVKEGNVLEAPEVFIDTDESGNKCIAWKPLEGAKSYRIYHKLSDDSYEIIAKRLTDESNMYYSDSLIVGDTYSVGGVRKIRRNIIAGRYNEKGIIYS